MRQKTLIQVAAGLTTVVWVGVVTMRGAKFDTSLLSSFGAVVAVVAFAMTLFDRVLWRLPVVNIAFRNHSPLVRGTWKGQAASSRRNKPFDGFLVIDQTLSHVSVRMLMKTGWSETLAGRWGESDDKHPAIFYVWRRFPKAPNDGVGSDDEPGFIQYGAGILEICGSSPYQIKGPYWTSEANIGTMFFQAHKNKVCKSYDEATVLFGN